MKKAGIITHYYRNLNYGGSLQSYALCRVLQDLGVDAEQISYDMFYHLKPKTVPHRLLAFARKVKADLRYVPQLRGWERRRKSFYAFQKQIPHSQTVYHGQNISEAAQNYDIFVTGSDQVWNTQWYHPAFFLDFVPEGRKKIAYSASLGITKMDEDTRRLFTEHLKDYCAISVREADAVEMVSQCTRVPVVQTLDPTLLLTAAQWDEICAKPVIDEKYVFCFLLGDGREERQAVRQFADQAGLKVVTLPHFPCIYRKADRKFADISLYDVSPAKFISLIKHAEYVFTDSFHATVFSAIYEKQFFVFERTDARNMRSRIVSLLSLYGCEERFLDRPERLDCLYMLQLQRPDYTCAGKKIQQLRGKSISFLKDNMVG